MKENTATTRKLQQEMNLEKFLIQLKTGDSVSMDSPENPPWFQEGNVYQLSAVAYCYFAETSVLRWTGANSFAASERGHPLQLFWASDSKFFGRQLTAEESFCFCQLTDTKLHT